MNLEKEGSRIADKLIICGDVHRLYPSGTILGMECSEFDYIFLGIGNEKSRLRARQLNLKCLTDC